VRKIVQPFNLSSLEVVTGSDPSVKGQQNIWVRLNRQVDTNVQSEIKNLIQNKYSQASVAIDDLKLSPLSGEGAAHTVTVVGIAFKGSTAPSTSDIATLLKNLPDTSDPTKGPPTSSPTPTVTASPSATGTAKVTGKASPTPTPKTTPTASSSPVVGV
jgi:hypothetical protein